jgi:hypothetical protein
MSKDDQKGADGSSVGCHAEAVVDWVLQRGYQRVALQLPDDLLAHATAYAAAIEAKLTPSHTVRALPSFRYQFIGHPLNFCQSGSMHIGCCVG